MGKAATDADSSAALSPALAASEVAGADLSAALAPGLARTVAPVRKKQFK